MPSLWALAATLFALLAGCQCFIPVVDDPTDAATDGGADAGNRFPDGGIDPCDPIPEGARYDPCCVNDRPATCYCAPGAVCSFQVEARPDGGCTDHPDGGNDRPEGWYLIWCGPSYIATPPKAIAIKRPDAWL